MEHESLACAELSQLTQRVARLEREVAWLDEWIMSIEVDLESLLSSSAVAVQPIPKPYSLASRTAKDKDVPLTPVLLLVFSPQQHYNLN